MTFIVTSAADNSALRLTGSGRPQHPTLDPRSRTTRPRRSRSRPAAPTGTPPPTRSGAWTPGSAAPARPGMSRGAAIGPDPAGWRRTLQLAGSPRPAPPPAITEACPPRSPPSPNNKLSDRGGRARNHTARRPDCASGSLQQVVHFSARTTWRLRAGNLAAILSIAFGVDARYVSGAMSFHRSARWFDWAGERFSAHSFGDDRLPRFEAAIDPVGTAGPFADSPAGRFTLPSHYGGVHE